MIQIPDHPDIRRSERDGVHQTAEPICPVCGYPCETVYFSCGEIIGCDSCLTAHDASEVEECYERS